MEKARLGAVDWPGISVRQACGSDAASLIAIMDDATRYKVERGDLAWGPHGDSARRVARAIERGEMHVVSHAGKDIGTACIQWDDEPYWGTQPPVAGYLHGLAINNGFHGAGIGSWVMDWAQRHVSAQGRGWLRLDCSAGNPGLCRYYERCGFVRVGEQVFANGHVAALYQRAADRAMYQQPLTPYLGRAST
ncbi:GNAT family N-acetyltransferase [Acidovorax sp. Leaf78]|uniref:GNAT family N-acetyltransferase n=1 Tax=Acidovorax sp. Leaf78 TaxID=1736237 RepID=UPI000B1241A2|nr:GNAT family N-acetyltransferase [Acidovorax sp. Leaf78]